LTPVIRDATIFSKVGFAKLNQNFSPLSKKNVKYTHGWSYGYASTYPFEGALGGVVPCNNIKMRAPHLELMLYGLLE
jgi:hypothetical protein